MKIVIFINVQKNKIHLDSLPSSVEKPEWIVKATLVRKMLECEKRSIAEP